MTHISRSKITLALLVSMLTILNVISYGSSVFEPLNHYNPPSNDTIPIKDRDGDFVTDTYYNPFDIQSSEIKQTVEYDIETGQYIIYEKIGDEYYRMPVYLTMEEYLEYTRLKEQRERMLNLAGVQLKKVNFDADADPIAKFDLEGKLTDRLFGGVDIEIAPTGFLELPLGWEYNYLDNPTFTEEQKRMSFLLFDPQINAGVNAKIGEKLNLDFDYNTLATFDFENTLNFAYNSEDFDEDDIIKRVEAGNVSLPLKGQLIRGNQNLFGLLSEFQFGHFRITGIMAQSRSTPGNITIENGQQIHEFRITPDQYDENRHFFLSHYFRDQYENALSNLPQIRSQVRITNIEVWVTNDQNRDLQNSTTVAALADLGESDLTKFTNPNTSYTPRNSGPNFQDLEGNQLPDNRNSGLFTNLVNDDITRSIVNAPTRLQTTYGQTQTRDFEVNTMRKLRPNEYTFNAQLGFISLNTRLRPNQVLGVAFEYTYSSNGEEVYKVGELTNETSTSNVNDQNLPEPKNVIYVKLLKSSNQRIDMPTWDLMMKNVYSLPTAQLNREDFVFDVFYEDYATNTFKRYIPDPSVRNIPLMSLFRLDQLNAFGDPQPDGEFDYIEGVTINPRTGSVFYPVLEPFGSSLLELVDGNQEIYERFQFDTLYSGSITQAQQTLDQNRFVMKGEYKSSTSSEYSLGAFNVPEGSVKVTVGSQVLIENVDYEVYYGIGRLKILNEAYLQQGVPINISFEDNAIFSTQNRTLFGLRGDYQASENFQWGFTYMRLFERPFTQKVNIGNDPINNRVFGLDFSYNVSTPFLTKALDALPFYSTSAESSIAVTGEVAAIKPGHSKAINVPGEPNAVVSLDDFEGASSNLRLSTPQNAWVLASTPLRPIADTILFPEARLTNNLEYGVNRALCSWYTVTDFRARNDRDSGDPYTRGWAQTELFNRNLDVSQVDDIFSFDINYYPSERGPYNFDVPGGIPGISAGATLDRDDDEIKLNKPESRWAGLMRALPNNDFERSNYQYIEFWLLNPFIETDDRNHDTRETGKIVFNLGNVSEDILKDNLQFFENSIPTPGELTPTQNTQWGRVPLSTPNVDQFDLENLDVQDLGFDGLTDADEAQFYKDYIDQFQGANVARDPSNDNYVSFDDDSFGPETSLLERYKKFNNPQGNVPRTGLNIRVGNNSDPDAEDLNNNRSLEQNEAYYEYELILANDGGKINENALGSFLTDKIIPEGAADNEIWYQIRIPITDNPRAINNIQGFRAIQFMRMYMTGFSKPKTFRMAEFNLVRSQWRISQPDPTNPCLSDQAQEFSVDEVGFFENGSKTPFNYVLPKGIKQERLQGTFSVLNQDEQSLNLKVCNLPDSCEVSINKLQELDLRQFERMQMFVHAESKAERQLNDGDGSIFIRLGKDFYNNYYEVELPLVFSREENLPADISANRAEYEAEVWREENKFDFALKLLPQLKKIRNESNASLSEVFTILGSQFAAEDTLIQNNAKFNIKGNPSLGYVKMMMIGIKNPAESTVSNLCMDVWINELRLSGLNERGGYAGIGRVDIQLADLGNLSASASYSSLGYGDIDQSVSERNLSEFIDYNISTNLELGKFFPKNWALNIPFYYQYSKATEKEEFDQYELDLKVDEMLENPNLTPEERQDIVDRNRKQTTISTFNFTNVSKGVSPNRNKKREEKGLPPAKPKPWDISNFSLSYAQTEIEYKDDIIKSDKQKDQRGSLDYNYSISPKYIQPFKNIKGKALRFLKEFNFNPIPNGINFSTVLHRFRGEKLYRIPDINEGFEYFFNDQRFNWDRNYGLQWDLAKSLRLSYDARAIAVIDELRQVGIAPTRADREWQDAFGNDTDISGQSYTDIVQSNPSYPNTIRNQNIRDYGRMKTFNQGVTLDYTLPFRYFPGLDWIKGRAQYAGDYIWTAGSLQLNNPQNTDVLNVGHTIQNNQRISLNSTLELYDLYNKIEYFKKLTKKQRRNTRTVRRPASGDESAQNQRQRKDNSREPSTFEKIFVRPLLMLREVKFNFSRVQSTSIPGFMITPKYFGVSNSAPGYDFAFGLQPNLNDFLNKAADNGWLSESPYLNQQTLRSSSKTFEAKIELEPWNDFFIDLDFNKSFSENRVLDFLYDEATGTYNRNGDRTFGSFSTSLWGMSTLFAGDIDGIFNQFEKNRIKISERLRDDNPYYNNNVSPDEPHEKDGPLYYEGYGRQNQQVLIPAFIAAFTGENATTVDLDLVNKYRSDFYIPMPSWQLRYNGLNKSSIFKNIFASFSIQSGYSSTIEVNQFNTDLQYDKFTDDNFNPLNADLVYTGEFYIDPNISSKNYFSRYEIPDIVINEQFAPIIAIDMKTESGLGVGLDFAKSRTLQFSTGIGQLTEGRSTDYGLILEWTFDNVNIPFLTGKKRVKVPKIKIGVNTDDGLTNESELSAGFENAGEEESFSPMIFSLNVSYSDNVTFIHELDSGQSAEPTRGVNQIIVSPRLEYNITNFLTLIGFFDFNQTNPRVSGSYRTTNIRGGVTVRFNLN